jgi:hypothetical protein
MQTLKYNYDQQVLIKETVSRVTKADKKIMSVLEENRKIDLILEAFDKKQMALATDILKKLKALNFQGLETLAKGRDAAISDVTAALSNSQETGLVRKIINMFSKEKENPLVDSIAYASAVQNFFEMFSQYTSAMSGDDPEKSISELVTGKTKDELDDAGSVNALGAEEKKKLKNIKSLIAKGFKPDGKLASISKNWVDKYIGGQKGLDSIGNEILAMKVKDLKSVIASATESLKSVESVGQSLVAASTQSTTPTNAPTGSEQSTTTKSTTGTSSSKTGDAGKTANVASDKAKKAVEVLKKAKLNQMTIKTVVNALAKSNLL